MRYRIIIEIDVNNSVSRAAVNRMSDEMLNLAITPWSNPVFLSTEQVIFTDKAQVLYGDKK